MTSRGTKWTQHSGFAVLAIPDSGLFVRHGRLETGHGTPMEASELILFARRDDADKHADYLTLDWKKRDHSHQWHFITVSVLVSERK